MLFLPLQSTPRQQWFHTAPTLALIHLNSRPEVVGLVAFRLIGSTDPLHWFSLRQLEIFLEVGSFVYAERLGTFTRRMHCYELSIVIEK